MALHGEIRINNHPIGEWWAVRKEQINKTINDPKYCYECGVKVYDRWDQTPIEFNVSHAYNDGALVLASKVMANAAKLIKSDDG